MGSDVGIVVVVVEGTIVGSDDGIALDSIDGGVDIVNDGIVLETTEGSFDGRVLGTEDGVLSVKSIPSNNESMSVWTCADKDKTSMFASSAKKTERALILWLIIDDYI